jgi:hypothetical protein
LRQSLPKDRDSPKPFAHGFFIGHGLIQQARPLHHEVLSRDIFPAGDSLCRERDRVAIGLCHRSQVPAASKRGCSESGGKPWYTVASQSAGCRRSKRMARLKSVHDGKAMGFELANVHLGTAERRGAIKRDLEKRKWLVDCEREEGVRRNHARVNDWKAS